MQSTTTPPSTENSLETILIAVRGDEDDRADRLLDAAGEVADPENTRVVIAHVFERDGFDSKAETLGFTGNARPNPDDLATRVTPVRDIRDALDATGIDVEVRGLIGENGDGIVQIAEQVEADRVLVGGRSRRPTGKLVFGSTAQEVMLNAPCPVTFVRDQD